MVPNLSTSTSCGPLLAHSLAPFHFPRDPAALDHTARLDREADVHLSERRGPMADRLAHTSLDLCCPVAGGMA